MLLIWTLLIRLAAAAPPLMDRVVSTRGDDWATGIWGELNDPNFMDDLWVSIINATPYRWRRTYLHQYQVPGWQCWAEYVEPGQSFEHLVQRRNVQSLSGRKSAAQVRYELEGTSKPMGLQVEYRPGRPHHVWVRFLGELETLNNAKGSSHDLGFLQKPGGVGFLLAGTEGDFISNDGPLGWMQATLAEVGHLPLRELVMPRSHHAGMWKAVAPINSGSWRNTLTQADDLYSQLGNGGMRVLDVRATKWHGHFRESHAAKVGPMWHGMMGAGVEEMVDIINRFTSEVPGELIVVDIHQEARSVSRNWAELRADERAELYGVLRKLRHRLRVPDDEDLTRWPLRRFIGNGTTAVLVRVHHSWLSRDDGRPGEFPGGAEGFVTDLTLPYVERWSDENEVGAMMEDQLRWLREKRPRRDAPAYGASWLITQHAREVIFTPRTIVEMSHPAWRTLYHEFWDALTGDTYPNWIGMDGSHHSQLKAMAMAINHCLAARRCGALGGKVRGLPGGEGLPRGEGDARDGTARA